MYRAYICEGCNRPQKFASNIWSCVECDKEICDSCGWMYGHCEPCCEGKTETELEAADKAKFGY